MPALIANKQEAASRAQSIKAWICAATPQSDAFTVKSCCMLSKVTLCRKLHIIAACSCKCASSHMLLLSEQLQQLTVPHSPRALVCQIASPVFHRLDYLKTDSNFKRCSSCSVLSAAEGEQHASKRIVITARQTVQLSPLITQPHCTHMRAAAGIIRRAFRAKTFETLCCLKLKRLGCWRVYMQ
eukprot:10561-Heterococcus_DN1.PRE.2